MKFRRYLRFASAVILALGAISVLARSPRAHAPNANASGVGRPPILGVANIALKTDNLDLAAASKFYGGILGFQAPLTLNDKGGVIRTTYFMVNTHQYIELSNDLTSPNEDRLTHIGFETTDARKLREYLETRGVVAPGPVERRVLDILSFVVKDPDGHLVEFVQYLPSSLRSRDFEMSLASRRISNHIDHVGVTVRDQAAADRFYRDILGFHEIWHGGMTDDRTDWVMMRVPNGKDWLEYMLNVHNPSPRQLGVMHHLSLGVPSTAEVYRIAVERGYTGKEKPHIGRDGKWQYNMYDPNFTRVEVMEPKPVEKPCCSPITE